MHLTCFFGSPLAQFAFSLTSPQANGTAFAGTNTLTARDAYGNTVTSFNAFADHVTITADTPLGGTVSGIHGANVLNLAADFVNGVADLTTLGLQFTGNAATGTFTATAQTGETGTSGAVTVGAGPAARTGPGVAAGGGRCVLCRARLPGRRADHPPGPGAVAGGARGGH